MTMIFASILMASSINSGVWVVNISKNVDINSSYRLAYECSIKQNTSVKVFSSIAMLHFYQLPSWLSPVELSFGASVTFVWVPGYKRMSWIRRRCKKKDFTLDFKISRYYLLKSQML